MRTTMNRDELCGAALRRLGPIHSLFGQNESGECHCLGCSGDAEDQADFFDWFEEHTLSCAKCAKGYARPLAFSELSSANALSCPEFLNAKGEPCHTESAPWGWSLSQWSNAACGEAGEMANIVKKIDRGDFPLEQVREKLAHEIADVIIYCDLLAQAAGIELGEAVRKKFNIVSRRVGSFVRL